MHVHVLVACVASVCGTDALGTPFAFCILFVDSVMFSSVKRDITGE